MTDLLARAFEQLRTLSANRQNEIASRILNGLDDEAQWNDAFKQSQEALNDLVQQAMAEYRAAKSQELNTGEL
ncbi:MAG: hypothetical protein WA902_07855 [Thermosynechococcaceae cyanobacterium]